MCVLKKHPDKSYDDDLTSLPELKSKHLTKHVFIPLMHNTSIDDFVLLIV